MVKYVRYVGFRSDRWRLSVVFLPHRVHVDLVDRDGKPLVKHIEASKYCGLRREVWLRPEMTHEMASQVGNH
jgi:hypothetical protein